MNQLERTIHQEIAIRLRLAEAAGQLRAVWFAVPNGLFLPARTAAEKALAGRLIKQAKNRGALQPGVPDFCFAWAGGSGFAEIKRPAAHTLLGRTPKGVMSEKQIEFQTKCAALGIPHVVCTSWAEVQAALVEWGVLA